MFMISDSVKHTLRQYPIRRILPLPVRFLFKLSRYEFPRVVIERFGHVIGSSPVVELDIIVSTIVAVVKKFFDHCYPTTTGFYSVRPQRRPQSVIAVARKGICRKNVIYEKNLPLRGRFFAVKLRFSLTRNPRRPPSREGIRARERCP